ncbi:thrombospondin type 1 domain protein [Ancylostoma duodenale]|uniref:Thrombospondin type 1 domain protein n=1 Tax=Ancylostoma duodenale TaxID=51022 RepID=A0A0C2CNM0_9BILA|nr:thrombospondin type 1 domain protein [Ancylostoma duodenale]
MLSLVVAVHLLAVSLAYTIGSGSQATGCTTCTLPPAAAVPCNTCQTAPPAPPITLPPSQWSEWGPFGQCTASCGGGQHMRQRQCNHGCSSCQCIGPSTEIQACNTAPCPAACTTCQRPLYDPPTRPPCTTCANPVTPAPCTTCSYQPTQAPVPCLTCGAPAPTYIQPAPSSCTTCGQNLRFYDPYGNAGRKKRSGSLMDRLSGL